MLVQWCIRNPNNYTGDQFHIEIQSLNSRNRYATVDALLYEYTIVIHHVFTSNDAKVILVSARDNSTFVSAPFRIKVKAPIRVPQ